MQRLVEGLSPRRLLVRIGVGADVVIAFGDMLPKAEPDRSSTESHPAIELEPMQAAAKDVMAPSESHLDQQLVILGGRLCPE
jgi:hypothetical protein